MRTLSDKLSIWHSAESLGICVPMSSSKSLSSSISISSESDIKSGYPHVSSAHNTPNHVRANFFDVLEIVLLMMGWESYIQYGAEE